jgi:phosphoenolpyruvate---glycerone phosphotransferase subunit DhaK
VTRIKKLINDPDGIVSEVIDGMVYASDGRLTRVPEADAIMRTDLPNRKVALLIGGGSGHEPMYSAFVGDGLADAAVCGNIFAAPTPDNILATTRAIHRGRGVLYVYGNYAGDNMNFDIAAEMAADEGIDVMTLRVIDDVAAVPSERMDERRGIGGAFFQVKIAGAACRRAATLAEAVTPVQTAQTVIRSIGVALSPGSIPHTGEPTFELPSDEIEIGLGVHGEPGVARRPFMTVDEIVAMMLAQLLKDLPFVRGDRTALLVNSLGATTMMELLIANRRTRQLLDDAGVIVPLTYMGPYFTCQEMAGMSLSLMRLDPSLEALLREPAWSLAYCC